MARSYYYTTGEARVVKASTGRSGVKGWRLSVSYVQNPESKKKKTERADSNMKKFRMPDTPPLFLDEAEAQGKGTEFRNRVEDLIRGNRPHKSHPVERTVPVPVQLANARRQMRLMAARARQRIYDARMKRTLARQERIAEWQKWRDESIKLLHSHIEAQTTILLLDEPPSKNMKVSGYLRESTQKKAMLVMLFLKFMHRRDAVPDHFETGGIHAADVAAEVAELVGSSFATVYRAYREWRAGERTVEDDGVLRPGAFFRSVRGTHERRFLLNQEDLKTKFKKWMRKNLRKLSVEMAWKYLNETLLKQIDEATMRAHGIHLPVSKRTVYNWMLKCSRLSSMGKPACTVLYSAK